MPRVNRRAFLSTMLGAGAFALDLDRALWVPGRKHISIAKAAPLRFIQWYVPLGGLADHIVTGPRFGISAHSFSCLVPSWKKSLGYDGYTVIEVG